MSNINIIVIASLLFLSTLIVATLTNDRELKYNCSLAEISPDIPKEIKQQCRELREKSGRI
jgi:hypothetical protein